jgi:hypothetical protein
VTRVGTFRVCQTTRYCLDDLLLDMGQLSATAERAAGDYDKDGVRETNGQEIEGLLATSEPVTMVLVLRSSGGAGIYSINGEALG